MATGGAERPVLKKEHFPGKRAFYLWKIETLIWTRIKNIKKHVAFKFCRDFNYTIQAPNAAIISFNRIRKFDDNALNGSAE